MNGGRRARNRWLLRLLFLPAGLVLLLLLSLSPADPDLFPGGGPVVHVVDHGYHSGIVLRQADLRATAVEIGRTEPGAAERLRWLATRYPQAEWLEIGWGDAAFYQVTPTLADLDIWLGLRAILWPTESALQIVPIHAAPEDVFRQSRRVSLRLSPSGFNRLGRELAAAIPDRSREPLGPSLYGEGAFYPSALDYHLFRTCNHWISGLLRAAGVPSSSLPGTFSTTLMAELRWRAAEGMISRPD